jgi:hypothetical protein
MAGTSSITGEESILFADNASFNGTERGGKMTTDGQLWIGSTALPKVRLGGLTSPNSTLTIGYNSPNITLDVVGGSSSNNLIYVTSPTIDFTALGETTIFTTPLAQTFIGFNYGTIVSSANTVTLAPTFSIGWTNPIYNDFVPTATGTTLLTTSGQYDNWIGATNSGTVIFPANTAIKILIDGAATAIDFQGKLYIWGFYI